MNLPFEPLPSPSSRSYAGPGKAHEALLRRVGQGATGELIVATENLEAHLYLQRGRIAWAYNNREQSSFLSVLRQSCNLDDDTVREVLEECRKTRRHVAETLVAWGLVSEHDVRGALWSQIASTLRAIAAERESEALFLRRTEAVSYDDRLTFSIDEFDRQSFAVDPVNEQAQQEEISSARLQRSLSEMLPATRWVRVVRPGRQSSANLHLQMAAETLQEVGASEFVFRSPQGWLLATACEEGRVFCGLRPDALLSKARAVLGRELSLRPASPSPLSLGSIEPVTGGSPCEAALLDLFRQYDRMAALLHVSKHDRLLMQRKGAPAGLYRWFDEARQLLDLPMSSLIENSLETSAALLVVPGVRLVLPSAHVLGASDGAGGSLWIALCPSVIEGFGWGLLANALRTMRDCG